ncbi:MAG: integrase core domain-containing protein, partial [Legionella sp.]|nr:integrase core domain-containing protein [Legionella sp.]
MLNETLVMPLAHAREVLAIWKVDYNTQRAHSAIGNMPPVVYAKLGEPRSNGTGRSGCNGAPRRPSASPSQSAQMPFGLWFQLDKRSGQVRWR